MATLSVPNHTSTLEDAEALHKAVKGIIHLIQHKCFSYIKIKPEKKVLVFFGFRCVYRE